MPLLNCGHGNLNHMHLFLCVCLLGFKSQELELHCVCASLFFVVFWWKLKFSELKQARKIKLDLMLSKKYDSNLPNGGVIINGQKHTF